MSVVVDVDRYARGVKGGMVIWDDATPSTLMAMVRRATPITGDRGAYMIYGRNPIRRYRTWLSEDLSQRSCTCQAGTKAEHVCWHERCALLSRIQDSAQIQRVIAGWEADGTTRVYPKLRLAV